MTRALSKIAPDWWDYTTLDRKILDDASRLTVEDLEKLSRPGFQVVMYDTLQEFYLAEALEYINAWRQSTDDNPVGICGPIGPIEQLPLAAQLVNALDLDVRSAHFWGMDEWVDDNGDSVALTHPLSFARTDRELCFDRIRKELRMPDNHLHFPTGDLRLYSESYDTVRCAVMQGGQGEIKHWAFNDPPKREGQYKDQPPAPDEYRKLRTRVTDLHPMTVIQNARMSGSGQAASVPTKAATVGPQETWKAEKVSLWHPGNHDNAFGLRLTTLMVSQRIPDASVPVSLLTDHPNVQFNFYRPGIGAVRLQIG